MSPPGLSVFGGVLLVGATSAARQGRKGAATELLAEAAETANRAGVDRTDYEVPFGPSNVVVQTADCSVVAEDFVGASQGGPAEPASQTGVQGALSGSAGRALTAPWAGS